MMVDNSGAFHYKHGLNGYLVLGRAASGLCGGSGECLMCRAKFSCGSVDHSSLASQMMLL